MEKYLTRDLADGRIEVFSVRDGEAVSFHLTRSSADEAIKRYTAVDRRRENQKR